VKKETKEKRATKREKAARRRVAKTTAASKPLLRVAAFAEDTCQFNEGDRVSTPVGPGTVQRKVVNPAGCILRVELDAGGVISVDCRQVTAE
jgi:sRNA-binding protein